MEQMVESKIEALESSLLAALDETENPASRRYVRESLQLLLALEQEVEGVDAGTNAGGGRGDARIQQ